MDKIHVAALRNCRTELVGDLVVDELCDHLEKSAVFSSQMIAEILVEKTQFKQARKLLNDLPRRGPKAFEKFIAALGASSQPHLVNCLEEEVRRLRSLPPGEPWTAAPAHGQTAASCPEANISQRGMRIEQVCSQPTDSEQPMDTGDNPDISATTDTSVQETPSAYARVDSEDKYPMESDPRGYVYIINNITFQNPVWNREGAETDGSNLQRVFLQLGFKVEYDVNLSAKDMIEKVKSFASLDIHWQVDSCVLAILSHGDSNNVVYGVDGDSVNFKDLYGFFGGQVCPQLSGKPKLFVLQACRGSSTVTQPSGNADSHTDVVPMASGAGTSEGNQFQSWSSNAGSLTSEFEKILPPNSDVILAYSTEEGQVAYRNTVSGSWYISAFAEVFGQYHHAMHVVDMLVKVNDVVATRNSYQMPSPVVMTRKQWFLNAPVRPVN